jgi:hypothetical protein
MLELDFSQASIRIKNDNGKPFVYDVIRKKWLVLTPEEHVRQLLINFLITEKKYPQALIAVEKKLQVGQRFKRFDALVYNRDHQPWMLIECKEPEVVLSQEVLFQLLNYQRVVQSRYWLLTNGHQTFCADAANTENIVWLNQLPAFE